MFFAASKQGCLLFSSLDGNYTHLNTQQLKKHVMRKKQETGLRSCFAPCAQQQGVLECTDDHFRKNDDNEHCDSVPNVFATYTMLPLSEYCYTDGFYSIGRFRWGC